MIGRKVPTCVVGDRCFNAHDGDGKRRERRRAKRREKQRLIRGSDQAEPREDP